MMRNSPREVWTISTLRFDGLPSENAGRAKSKAKKQIAMSARAADFCIIGTLPSYDVARSIHRSALPMQGRDCVAQPLLALRFFEGRQWYTTNGGCATKEASEEVIYFVIRNGVRNRSLICARG